MTIFFVQRKLGMVNMDSPKSMGEEGGRGENR